MEDLIFLGSLSEEWEEEEEKRGYDKRIADGRGG